MPREGVKAAKAAKARALFANRPYRVSGTLKLDKPIQTVGEVSNRAALTKSAVGRIFEKFFIVCL